MGKAKRYVALTRVAYRTRGVREPEHVRKLFVRKPGDPRGDRLPSAVGPVGEGQMPNARHVHVWEVGRKNIIDEANELLVLITQYSFIQMLLNALLIQMPDNLENVF